MIMLQKLSSFNLKGKCDIKGQLDLLWRIVSEKKEMWAKTPPFPGTLTNQRLIVKEYQRLHFPNITECKNKYKCNNKYNYAKTKYHSFHELWPTRALLKRNTGGFTYKYKRMQKLNTSFRNSWPTRPWLRGITRGQLWLVVIILGEMVC